MHTVQLILRPAEYEKSVINKRFHAVLHIHNVCVKHAKKLLMQLDHDKEYQSWHSEHCRLLKQEELSKADRTRRLELSKQMSARRQEIGLSKWALQSYIKVCGKRYSKLISSQQVQAEASNVSTPLMTKLVGEQAIKAARMVIDAFLKGETSVKFGFDSYEPTFAMNTVFAVNEMCPPFTAFALCNDYRDFDASTGVLKWKIINVEPNELDEKLQKFETTAIDFMSVLREGDNETERALLLYSRLTAYAQYDYEAYENPQNLTEDEYIYRTSAYSVMCDGMGICYSFAEAMTFLCAQADIDCIEVNCINDSIAHQWNLIKLDGEYYYCDATWDVGGTFPF